MNIKVIEKQGTKDGKNIVILAGVHGNETCGVKLFDSFIQNIKIDSGKVTFIYANLEAIRQGKRFIEANLNRCFLFEQPDEIKKTLEGKTALEIMPYLEKADSMLDIHASYTKNSVPFVICGKRQAENAGIFDAEIVVCNIDPFHPGSTDYFMNDLKKPGFCFECGYLGDEKTKEIAEKAVISFLRYNKNIPGEAETRFQRKVTICGIYRNKFGCFKKARDFSDFETLEGKTLIGYDGEKEVFGMKGDILLFVRDCYNLGDECFLIGK